MCRLLATTLGALIGCTDVSTTVDNDPPVHASRADGHRAMLDAFGAKDDAYVVSEGQLAAGDYYYRVTDAAGTPLSADAAACRRVHVGNDGVINLVYTGADQGVACQHPCRFAASGLTVKLAPFADAAAGEYRVEVAQDVDFADAIADAFFIK
ncbi:MAG: hypothetical protein JO257_08775 [Deltaproteobacteria bacterium]|nr:hypothetical protein [Deltaproteobacteria bacterium]